MILCISWTINSQSVIAIGTILLSFFTLLLVYYGRKQLLKLNSTNRENFLHSIKMDFFSTEARRIMFFIDYDLLQFELYKININPDMNLAVFETKIIENEKARKLLMESINLESERINKDKTAFTSYEMDDFLLGNLEDLGALFKKKLIDIHSIDQMFGYYIIHIFENCAIKKYLEWAKSDDLDIYSNFEYMYHKLKLYQNKNTKQQ